MYKGLMRTLNKALDLDPAGVGLLKQILRQRKEYEDPQIGKYMLMTSRWLGFRMIPTAFELVFLSLSTIIYKETDLSLIEITKTFRSLLYIAEGLRASELLGVLGYRVLRKL